MLKQTLQTGLRRAGHEWHLVVPLWLVTTLLNLVSLWPLSQLFTGDLHSLLLRDLNNPDLGTTISSLLGGVNTGQIAAFTGLTGLAFVATLFITGLAYTFWSGGILSVYHNRRGFLAGCRFFFWSFLRLGIVIVVLISGGSIGLVILLGMLGVGLPGQLLVVGGFLLLVNALGEYTRAMMVVRDQRRLALRATLGFMGRHLPGVVGLLILEAALLALLTGAYHLATTGLASVTVVGLLIIARLITSYAQQSLKALRLGWALAYIEQAQPVPLVTAPVSQSAA